MNKLNEKQEKVANHKHGSCLCIAGAGSGKTHTLISRVAKLIDSGIKPKNILLLTFTRKAAHEMIERAKKQNKQSGKINAGTFHSFCLNSLKQYAKKELPNFTVISQYDAINIIKLVREKYKTIKVKNNVIQLLFSRSINFQKPLETLLDEYTQEEQKIILSIHQDFIQFKKEKILLDYDDLLIEFRTVLQNSKIQKRIAKKYQYIMVDEYQDTNIIQSDIVKLLTPHGNIMVVGDDAQSIYGFRGACYQNIISFPDLFENTEIIKLEENYRSIQKILELANRIFISKYDKNLFSRKLHGEKPFFNALPNDEEQTKYVVDNIQYYLSQGIPAKEIAVLYRVNFQANPIEEELSQRGIQYNKIGGLSFIEKAHIKDVLAFFKIIYNIHDEISWSRVLCLFNGVGINNAFKIIDLIQEDNLDLTSISRIDHKVISEFITWIKNAHTIHLDQLIELIIEKYMTLCVENYANFEERKEDLDFFTSLTKKYKTLESLIVGMALETEFSESNKKEEENEIVLSTIHSAKGLEWKVVIIINVCEGSIPFYLCISHDELEEEKRLLYVAVTRAKEHLHLTMAEQQTRSGYTFNNRPSRFLSGLKDFLK